GLLPFAWAFGFCFPAGDDFDEATRAMFLFDLAGGLYEIGREWLSWSGRYTYHFLAVFLGKAAELRLMCGLVCGAVLALHGAAFYGLARVAGLSRRNAAPVAALGLLALCGAYQQLPVFYLLTESLTSGLQSALALLFLWSLCLLWKRCPDAENAGTEATRALRRARRLACGLGVAAVGVFEHAALAVLFAAGVACALAFADGRTQEEGDAARERPGTPRPRLAAFLTVAFWCVGAALFSFLAPGNFARRAARGVDAETVRRQLEAVPADWLQALAGFVHSLWPVAAVVLALLLVFLGSKGPRSLTRVDALRLAALAPAAFCLFSLALTTLHALSDVPLMGAAKLPASLSLYAAVALCFTVYGLLLALPARPAWGRAVALLAGAALMGLCLNGDNFQRTLRTAVNGDLSLYARAMEARADWLRQEGAHETGAEPFRFGLMGELLHPGSRKRAIAPGAPVTLVAQWPRAVFPVIGRDGLSGRAPRWPNPWAAWLYG
ncbi:MAG: hypothetical protein K2G99_00060, partial [Desulfovibrio sp.]|nr:hypothetical protein [Desulfovibrio sp.]